MTASSNPSLEERREVLSRREKGGSLSKISHPPFKIKKLISTFGPESIKGSNRLQVYERECASGLFKVQPGNRHKNQSIVRHGPQMKFTGPEGAS